MAEVWPPGLERDWRMAGRLTFPVLVRNGQLAVPQVLGGRRKVRRFRLPGRPTAGLSDMGRNTVYWRSRKTSTGCIVMQMGLRLGGTNEEPVLDQRAKGRKTGLTTFRGPWISAQHQAAVAGRCCTEKGFSEQETVGYSIDRFAGTSRVSCLAWAVSGSWRIVLLMG